MGGGGGVVRPGAVHVRQLHVGTQHVGVPATQRCCQASRPRSSPPVCLQKRRVEHAHLWRQPLLNAGQHLVVDGHQQGCRQGAHAKVKAKRFGALARSPAKHWHSTPVESARGPEPTQLRAPQAAQPSNLQDTELKGDSLSCPVHTLQRRDARTCNVFVALLRRALGIAGHHRNKGVV